MENPIFGMCQCVCMRRKGYDDPISLAGVYRVDDNGEIMGTLIGYDKAEGNLRELREKINNNGIKGYGKLFLTGDTLYTDFEKLKSYVEKQINEKNKNLIQE